MVPSVLQGLRACGSLAPMAGSVMGAQTHTRCTHGLARLLGGLSLAPEGVSSSAEASCSACSPPACAAALRTAPRPHPYATAYSTAQTASCTVGWPGDASAGVSSCAMTLPRHAGGGAVRAWDRVSQRPQHPTPPAMAHPSSSGSSGSGSVRSFAKRATTGKAPPVRRRSYTRLFACRNDRFRSAFEQIWPTLRLTEDELQLFRRNSRLFVVETGRAISLKHKFEMSRPQHAADVAADAQPLKPHYSQVRPTLFESDLHLDAAGEHPRYLKIRRLRSQFGVRLQNMRKVRLLLGFVRRGYLQKLWEQAQVQPGANKAWKLVCAMESRLGMFALRCGLAHDILAANTMIRHKIYLNGTPPPMKQAYFVQPGDVVSPAPHELSAYKRHVAGEMGTLLNEVHRDFLG